MHPPHEPAPSEGYADPKDRPELGGVTLGFD
jgi:hypothetical protein